MTEEKIGWRLMIFIACLFLLIIGMITYLVIDKNGKNFREDSLVILWLLILFYVIYEAVYLYKGESLGDSFKQKISFEDFLWDNLIIGSGVVITVLGLMGLKKIINNIRYLTKILYEFVVSLLGGIYGVLINIFKNKSVIILVLVVIGTMIIKYLLYLVFKARQKMVKPK